MELVEFVQTVGTISRAGRYSLHGDSPLTAGLSCFQRRCRRSQTNAFAERRARSQSRGIGPMEDVAAAGSIDSTHLKGGLMFTIWSVPTNQLPATPQVITTARHSLCQSASAADWGDLFPVILAAISSGRTI